VRTRTYTQAEMEHMADLVDQAIAVGCAEFYVRGAMAAFVGTVHSGMSNAELIAAGHEAVAEHRTVNPRIGEMIRNGA
jgi:uncharacterized Zn-binding protein involved in type VI secretion